MNKILTAIIIVLLLIISLLTCHIMTKPKVVDPPINKSGGCPDTLCMTSHIDGDIPGTLSGSTLRALSQLYLRDLAKSKVNYASDPETTINDAMSICFDLKKMKELIYRIERTACKSGCDDGKQLGIRFYYIKYPETVGPDGTYSDLRLVPEECANKHSIAMVPAYKDGDFWYDFEFEIPGKECKLSKASDNSKHIGLIVLGDGTNHGGIAPPPDPGTFPTNDPE